jgi:hypothetical protein
LSPTGSTLRIEYLQESYTSRKRRGFSLLFISRGILKAFPHNEELEKTGMVIIPAPQLRVFGLTS